MISSHDALHQTICAFPDEDTPRLIFADLIEENGDDLRARFIRTQITLAREPRYSFACVLASRLMPDAATGWAMAHTLPRVPDGFGWHKFEFHRGFPWLTEVSSPAAFLPAGEALFAAAPIQALAIDARNVPKLAELAAWPHLERLHKLEFSFGDYTADDIHLLAESEFAGSLTDAVFAFSGISSDGLTALAESRLFTALRNLELTANNIPPVLLVDSLAAAKEGSALQRLAVSRCRIDSADVAHLVSLPLMQTLQQLDLSDNTIGADGAIALAGSTRLGNLQMLNLSRTRPGVPGISALADIQAAPRMLDLSENGLGPVAMKALTSGRSLNDLRVLHLRQNPIGDSGAAALAAWPALVGLLELDLRDTGIGDAGALALAASPYLRDLMYLDLRGCTECGFGPRARAALVNRFGDMVRF